MSVATTTAIGIAAGVGAAGAIGGAVISSNAAGHAADAQSNAAMNAAQLQHQDAQSALDFNKQVYGNQMAVAQPFIKGGTAAYANLLSLMGTLPPSQTGQQLGQAITRGSDPLGSIGDGGIRATQNVLNAGAGQQPAPQMNAFEQARENADRPMNGGARFADFGAQPVQDGSNGNNLALDASGGPAGLAPIDLNSQVNPALGAPGSLAQGWQGGKFVAPDNVTEQNDPGFQFRLAQGQKAIEQSAAARGGLLSGGTAKALNDYSQGQASNEYGNVYSRALGEYQQNYNQFQQQSADKYNRLANLAGMGQISAQQLGQQGSQAAGNNAYINLTSGGQIGQNLNNAGAATASGYIGGANAWNSGLSGVANAASSYGLLSLLGNNGGFGGGVSRG